MRTTLLRARPWETIGILTAMGLLLLGLGRGWSVDSGGSVQGSGPGREALIANAPIADPEPRTLNPAAADSQGLARRLIERAGIQRGVCAVIGDQGDLPLELARLVGLLVHVRRSDPAAVADLRRQADAAGLDIDRLAAEQGRQDKLPYADNMIDVLIATHATPEGPSAPPLDEVLRVLRPEGTALLSLASPPGRSAAEIEKLRQQAEAGVRVACAASPGQFRPPEVWQDPAGPWLQVYKPVPQGVDDWSHWEHRPDNNPVSTDSVIRAPYLTQFLSGPFYICMPAITTVAGGRTFLAIGNIAHHRREWGTLNTLIARNGYNGTILWQRKLPEGYLVHRSAFVATKETFYMIDGDRCLLLDPETGREKGEIRIPGVQGEWKWMALSGIGDRGSGIGDGGKDRVLYVLAGQKGPDTQTTKRDRPFGGWSWNDLSPGYYQQPRVPWGFGNTLAAYRLRDKRLLWKHQEQTPIDSRAMAICQSGNTDKVFLYCPDKHLRCLAAASGEVLWTNDDSQVLALIERPGRGLVSTPGFRSCCMAVATPKALVIQGQTRMNVIAVSADDGSMLWRKRKITNNPNAIYADGMVVLGVGPRGSHVAIDPQSGEVLEDLRFHKVACSRLTGCPDSFFCRGEGTLRFDRQSKRVLIDGAARPACNDGALPADGLLYLGPWQCDCNLSLIGLCTKCPAGDFRFDYVATEAERLETSADNPAQVAPLDVSARDWPTHRGSTQRRAGTKARLAKSVQQRWQYVPDRSHVPTAPTSAGELILLAGDDGKVRALEAESGRPRWVFATPAAVKMPPTIADGRAYFGSGDGYVYALEAASGRLLWRFRAAPVERHIMVYGSLSSTWPVSSGVLVHDGVAYCAAGIIDSDGTYVYALDAATGRIVWQNNSSGHLNAELRKGVSAQGDLTIRAGRLLLAGGNQVSPAEFDLATGKCLAGSFDQGYPKANHGKFVGVFKDRYAISGGRILYSAPENLPSKGCFVVQTQRGQLTLNFGGIPPAWNEDTLALVNFIHGKLCCCDAQKAATRIEQGFPQRPGEPIPWNATLVDAFQADGAVRWQFACGDPEKFQVTSLAVATTEDGASAVVAVLEQQDKSRAQPEWSVQAFDAESGAPYWRQSLDREPLPGGLLVDRRGQVLVTLLDGSVVCLAPL